MPKLKRPEDLIVDDWVLFQQGGIRAIPGFGEGTTEELREHGWDVGSQRRSG